MKTPIAAWTLQGLINGERVDVMGAGEFDPTSGRLALNLHSNGPLPGGFDLIPAQMICNVAATGYAAASSADSFSWATFAPDGFRVSPARIGRVHTKADVEVLSLSAVTTLTLREDGLHVDNMVEGSAHLPDNITIVSASETLLPHGSGHGVGLAQFVLEADDDVLTGVTTSPYQFGGDTTLPSMFVRTLDFTGSSRCEDGARIEARSTWTSLVAACALHT